MSADAAVRGRQLFVHDVFLIGIMAVLAACGLIYEYLLSHYAARILGTVEAAIYTMIGLMIVSMGLGAFAARLIREPFTAFAFLESAIACLGAASVLMIAAAVAFSAQLPQVLADTFSLPPDLVPRGGMIASLNQFARLLPYAFGIVVGFLIGMEIPLIARVREQLYGEHLEHNIGTIYGADYIGAGIGAAIWVSIMLSLDITEAAVWTASANLLAGLIFLLRYRQRIGRFPLLLLIHGLVLVLILIMAQTGDRWMRIMTNMLYADEVVFDHSSHYQHFALTERYLASRSEPVYGFFLNGRLQFSSQDEHIYHGMLVYPAMMVADQVRRVLIIGGGDGLALRDVLRFDPEQVTLVDLDAALTEFFTAGDSSESSEAAGSEQRQYYQRQMAHLNQHSFDDPRVEVIHNDAFIEADRLLNEGRRYDVILVDLPDPSHPDLDRLYSDYFYHRLGQLLTTQGALAVQSTSPFHARKAFISIGKTLSAAGFSQVEQYRQNVPSFGEWGWSIATHQQPARKTLMGYNELPVAHPWLTRDLLIAAFEFPADFYRDRDDISVNNLGTNTIFRYHSEAWQRDMGIYQN
ncbi:MAG: polyamine aminopropyltransferase [Pseudomonadales bacterium]|nr:polyamine aminopropyltransferase [Pseudomonadales bacterium]